MGNIIDSLVSGFTKVLADILSKPLDFLSGKTCSSACGSTWDVVCYVENFCVASLAKMAAMLFLLYLVLVFFYLVYKLGICRCVCHGVCTIVWSCISCSFSACKNGCAIACVKMRDVRRARRKRRRRSHGDIEENSYLSSSDSESEDCTRHRTARRGDKSGRSLSRRSGDRKRVYLERSLRTRNHRVTVGIGRRCEVADEKGHGTVLQHHGVKVTHTSPFAHKGSCRRAYRAN
ncbi:uncharacterized protein [Lolium perenne]|uniref:uncharacterized protein n=1 Tax=Lolium perenne TaxID=4522 RepID=UPI0021EAAD26|nr:uncharacterized protein LOC127348998 [Lolium perenne]